MEVIHRVYRYISVPQLSLSLNDKPRLSSPDLRAPQSLRPTPLLRSQDFFLENQGPLAEGVLKSWRRDEDGPHYGETQIKTQTHTSLIRRVRKIECQGRVTRLTLSELGAVFYTKIDIIIEFKF